MMMFEALQMNGFKSSVFNSVLLGTVFSPFLFLMINDLNQAIKFCKVHHFADQNNLLHFNKSIAKLNKLVNSDMKSLVEWLNASYLN